uniref:Uncharacterized protein n=1 Tax=Eutreptiella gymnastica TaxID=73025 RepID=A0A7S4FWU9_9EUGL
MRPDISDWRTDMITNLRHATNGTHNCDVLNECAHTLCVCQNLKYCEQCEQHATCCSTNVTNLRACTSVCVTVRAWPWKHNVGAAGSRGKRCRIVTIVGAAGVNAWGLCCKAQRSQEGPWFATAPPPSKALRCFAGPLKASEAGSGWRKPLAPPKWIGSRIGHGNGPLQTLPKWMEAQKSTESLWIGKRSYRSVLVLSPKSPTSALQTAQRQLRSGGRSGGAPGPRHTEAQGPPCTGARLRPNSGTAPNGSRTGLDVSRKTAQKCGSEGIWSSGAHGDRRPQDSATQPIQSSTETGTRHAGRREL